MLNRDSYPPATLPGSIDYSLPATRYPLLLLSYFRSGWAFLIPYLAAYLLYTWLRWPVNPVDGGQWTVTPCLLHVYWLFHALHLLLGAVALRAWWRGSGATVTGATNDRNKTAVGATSSQPPTVPLRRDRLLSTGYRLLPWILLGLLFWIPGVYMEWPADPWQHFARVNEWSWHDLVTQHMYWKKSGSFLAYSLIGRITPPLLQLKWFDLYYTACCLLLCWQYYRLARALGLGARLAMLFVGLQAVLMGNNIFGFYRYYGMSTTLFAQLGTVALIRIALEYFSSPRITRTDTKNSPRNDTYSLLATRYSLLRSVGAALALLPLIAFNHVQGLGLAALGVAAVVVWRLIAWRRSMIGWLALLAVALSVATILWYPRHAYLDSLYQPRGWLTPWYGFNLLAPSSPAWERTFQILGLPGLINLVAGLILLRRNHVAGWLTVMPFLLLSLPCVAIPFASVLAADKSMIDGYILVFHRMLFAIPAGLALVALLGEAQAKTGDRRREAGNWEREVTPGSLPAARYPLLATILPSPFLLLVVTLLLLTTLPAGRPYYGRLYNTLLVPADDVRLAPVVAALTPLKDAPAGPPRLSTSQGLSYVAASLGIHQTWYPQKFMSHPTAETIQWTMGEFQKSARRKESALAFIPSPLSLYTPASSSAYLSGHWLPQQAALEHIQGAGIELLLNQPGVHRRVEATATWYSLP